MERIVKKITDVTRAGVDASIATYVRTYGRECQIYLPKKTGSYSGSLDDVSYNKDPDEIRRMFIPNLFNRASRTPVMGFYDVLGIGEYYWITHDKDRLPLYTKIVATSPVLGTIRFIIRDSDYASTFEGSIYVKVRLEILYDTTQDNDGLAGLRFDTSSKLDPGEVDTSIATSTNTGSSKFQYYQDNEDNEYHDN